MEVRSNSLSSRQINILHEGYLVKSPPEAKLSTRSSWLKRRFSLRIESTAENDAHMTAKRVLRYCKCKQSCQGCKTIGNIALSDINCVSPHPGTLFKFTNIFMVFDREQQRTFYLSAPTPDDRCLWLTAITHSFSLKKLDEGLLTPLTTEFTLLDEFEGPLSRSISDEPISSRLNSDGSIRSIRMSEDVAISRSTSDEPIGTPPSTSTPPRQLLYKTRSSDSRHPSSDSSPCDEGFSTPDSSFVKSTGVSWDEELLQRSRAIDMPRTEVDSGSPVKAVSRHSLASSLDERPTSQKNRLSMGDGHFGTPRLNSSSGSPVTLIGYKQLPTEFSPQKNQGISRSPSCDAIEERNSVERQRSTHKSCPVRRHTAYQNIEIDGSLAIRAHDMAKPEGQLLYNEETRYFFSKKFYNVGQSPPYYQVMPLSPLAYQSSATSLPATSSMNRLAESPAPANSVVMRRSQSLMDIKEEVKSLDTAVESSSRLSQEIARMDLEAGPLQAKSPSSPSGALKSAPSAAKSPKSVSEPQTTRSASETPLSASDHALSGTAPLRNTPKGSVKVRAAFTSC